MIIYNKNFQEKVDRLKEKENLEEILLSLERKYTNGENIEEYFVELKGKIERLQEQLSRDDDRKYLAEIILEEKVQFTSNSLILAPVGSGKTTLIKDVLIDKSNKDKVLILVSTGFLKDTLIDSDKIKEKRSDRLRIMTYHEFGLRISNNNDFMEKFNQIFCDEIHSLPEYKTYEGMGNKLNYALEHSIKYLFNKQEGKEIYYFTATDLSLRILEETRPGLMKDVSIHDFRFHPNIKQYTELSKTYITHIEQIRPILKYRLKSISFFKYKGIAFAKTIKSLKMLEKILIEENIKPLVLWSDSNEEYKLSKKQLKARKYLMETGKIPDEYDFLIMNSSMREGWDLNDKRVNICIMNTTNETDIIQSRGRVRKDVDLMILKTSEDFSNIENNKIIERYLNRDLSVIDKENLCKELNIRNKKNYLFKWTKIKKLLEENGYKVKQTMKTIDSKRVKFSIISKEGEGDSK